jgi:FkbM family methyltransferase
MFGWALNRLIRPFRRLPWLRGAVFLRMAAVRLVPQVSTVTNHGLRMVLDLRDDMHWDLFRTGHWEPAETAAVRDALWPGATFYDVGANVGYFSLVASQFVGAQGRVIAFEPLAKNRERLTTNVALNRLRNVTVVEYGLSDTDAVVDMAFPGGETGMASIRTMNDPTYRERVHLRRGDVLVEELSLPLPDVIKIDVEGAEAMALRGLGRQLDHVSTVIIEISPPYLAGLGSSEDELRRILAEHGLNQQRVLSRVFCPGEDGAEFYQTNEIFVRQRVAGTPA